MRGIVLDTDVMSQGFKRRPPPIHPPSRPTTLGAVGLEVRKGSRITGSSGDHGHGPGAEGEPPILSGLAVDLGLPIEALVRGEGEGRQVDRHWHRQRGTFDRPSWSPNLDRTLEHHGCWLAHWSRLSNRLTVLVQEPEVH